jgi:hypothetical protein
MASSRRRWRLEKTTTSVLGNEIDWEERRPNKCKQKVTRAKLQMYTSIPVPILPLTHVDATVAWPRWQKRGLVAFWTGGERLNEIRDPEMRFQSSWTYLTQHDKFKGPPCISLFYNKCAYFVCFSMKMLLRPAGFAYMHPQLGAIFSRFLIVRSTDQTLFSNS